MQLPIEGKMPSLSAATEWFNSKPLKMADLKGKVVLVTFWTYTCINWLRTHAYVKAWAEKYKAQGLIVIGVHTPEFIFEKEKENVAAALQERSISYPVVMDNDYRIWESFSNNYWPAFYFVDGEGNIRHHQYGEGGYTESEHVLQALLKEAGGKDIDQGIISPQGIGLEAQPDWKNLGSAENYLGYARTSKFMSPGAERQNEAYSYKLPARLAINEWALDGQWTMRDKSILSNKPNAKLSYRFHARDLHLVMGPAQPGVSIRFRVLIDGRPPATAHGGDVDAEGNGIIKGQRLYQLIRQQGEIEDRVFEIEFLDPGAELFAFTFG